MAGSPLIKTDLKENPEYAKISRQRVARVMKEMGLRCRTVKRFIAITDSKHYDPIALNLLNRNFSVSKPD